jgi:MFS-type transporter involved in bile tolerance (Atg22 family)
MDPNLFHLDWERLFEVLITIVVLSFLTERALAVLFESRFFVGKLAEKSYKEPIAFVVCALVCVFWKFDALSTILLRERVTVYGAIITGAVIAGGSKASIKLFRDILGFMSSAEKERQLGLSAKKAKVDKGGGS